VREALLSFSLDGLTSFPSAGSGARRGSVRDGPHVNAEQQHALDASSSVSCDAMVSISQSFFPYASS
jgi:hypothetical protein